MITGAASGIGRATCHAFAAEGVTKFVLADVNYEGLKTTSSELQTANRDIKTLFVKTDTSKESDVEHMVASAVKEFGSIAYCVNAAGVTSAPRKKTHELPMEAWDRVIAINLRGVHLCAKAEITQMLKQECDLPMITGAPAERGSIVNISSILGRTGNQNSGSYTAAKHGVLGLTRNDACAYSREGIRVNAVCPGAIYTPLMEQSLAEGSAYDKVLQRTPVSAAAGVWYPCRAD